MKDEDKSRQAAGPSSIGWDLKESHSTLGRLLEEISWEGNARKYRRGGRGLESILTAEVFQALDFLPRTEFLGRVVKSVEGGDPETLRVLSQEAEETGFSLLPGDIFMAIDPATGKETLSVQPDGVLESPSVYCLIEAKRIRSSAFQPEQLAREMLAVLQESKGRRPLLLLVLSSPPPVSVRGHGKLSVHEAVTKWLEPVLEKAQGEFPPLADIVVRIDSVIAYTTWQRIADAVAAGRGAFSSGDASVDASVSRLADAALQAIDWHG